MADFTQTSLSLFPNPTPVQFNPIANTDLVIGTPVYQLVSDLTPGEVGKARAAAGLFATCGFAALPGTAGKRVRTQFTGPLTLTALQWAAISSDVADDEGLATGQVYYLSATLGKITKTAPDTFKVQVGVALGPDTLLIQPGLRLDV